MGSSNFWDNLSTALDEYGYTPGLSTSRSSRSGLSMHQLVLVAHGLSPDLADYSHFSFWRHHEYLRSSRRIWLALQGALPDSCGTGGVLVGQVWFDSTDRTEIEIRTALDRGRKLAPQLMVEFFVARPDFAMIVDRGSLRAAIANTLGVVVGVTRSTWGDQLQSLTDLNLSDHALLDHLDAQLGTSTRDISDLDLTSLVPRLLLRAWSYFSVHNRNLKASQDSSETSTSSFIAMLKAINQANNLAGNSDQALAARLLKIAPENANSAVAKRLEQLGLLIST